MTAFNVCLFAAITAGIWFAFPPGPPPGAAKRLSARA